MGGGQTGNLFVSPLVSETDGLVDALQIYFLQPLYSLTFTNGLIACLVFMGIGSITDIHYLVAKPTMSLLLAVAAEMGARFSTLPIAVALGFSSREAAAIALVGGADGPDGAVRLLDAGQGPVCTYYSRGLPLPECDLRPVSLYGTVARFQRLSAAP